MRKALYFVQAASHFILMVPESQGICSLTCVLQFLPMAAVKYSGGKQCRGRKGTIYQLREVRVGTPGETKRRNHGGCCLLTHF